MEAHQQAATNRHARFPAERIGSSAALSELRVAYQRQAHVIDTLTDGDLGQLTRRGRSTDSMETPEPVEFAAHSESWGVERFTAGTRVWAQVALGAGVDPAARPR